MNDIPLKSGFNSERTQDKRKAGKKPGTSTAFPKGPGNVYSSGELAAQANVNIETIRYYERKGLLPAPTRNASGYRQFSTDALARLEFIKNAKRLGFSLGEIGEFIALQVLPGSACVDVKEIVEIKIEEIERKMESLRSMRKALKELAVLCKDGVSIHECRFIEVLGDFSGG